MNSASLIKPRMFILNGLMIFLCASTVVGIDIHMTNNLGKGTILMLHCLRNSKDLGHQQVPDNWTCTWRFAQSEYETTQLQCEANLEGANQLKFVAFNDNRDSCTTDCDWKFTKQGVFAYRDGEWKFQYAWPH